MAASIRCTAIAAAVVLAAGPAASGTLKDPYFGEALYYAYQGRYFDALERLDAEIAQHYGVDEPQLDSLQRYIGQAEFSVGDFELRYRMHQRAGRAIKAVLEGDVDEAVRNDAAFRLARLHFQQGQSEDALRVLDKVHGRVPEKDRDDLEFLRANVDLALGRPTDAVGVLQGLQGSDELQGFAAYNLGIALLQAGRQREAIEQLDRAGRVKGDDPATLAIRDKSNLVLGTLLFESSAFDLAQQALDRVRLSGPFSNEALLRSGWADVSAKKFDRALVPWKILAERDTTDPSVQEAMLALPYAYSKLDVHGRAAVLYGRAVDCFGHELDKLDASIKSVREGAFLADLSREEIRQDEDWVVRLRSLPDAPETFYLISLMASNDFQTALQNYLDLHDLRKRLVSWQTSFDAFEDLIRMRRSYYEPLLPEIDGRFRKLDARVRLRLEQREHLDERLQHLLIAPRPELLATGEERQAASQLEALKASLSQVDPARREALRGRIQRLEGVLTWNLDTQYHQRLTDAHAHLRELNADVDAMNAQYESFVRARQAAAHSYLGYDDEITALRGRTRDAIERVDVLIARQGHLLETVAIAELESRRERLETYQSQARFAFADSYDRATKAQAQ